MMKYDHGKIAEILLAEYRKKYGNGNPSLSIQKLIDCMDDAFVDEWIRCVANINSEVSQNAADVLKTANETIEELRAEIIKNQKAYEDAKEMQVIHDERVVDALKAYQAIVDMDFDTPQQRLQNIQNASYFIWALYAQSGTPNTFIKEVSDVKVESSMVKDEWTPVVPYK